MVIYEDLADKVVVVTGSSRGIGLAIAEAFAQQKSKVVMTGRNEEQLAKAAEGLSAYGAQVLTLSGDVTDKGYAGMLKERTYDTFQVDSIDVLVNNAGSLKTKLFVLSNEETERQMMDVHYHAASRLIRAFLRDMYKKESGSIINISSVSGSDGASSFSSYGAAKAALDNLTKSLAQESGKKNIRLNSLAVGLVDTEMSENLSEKQQEVYFARTALGRFVKPAEVANAVLFLASSQSSAITGQIYRVDAGYNLG